MVCSFIPILAPQPVHATSGMKQLIIGGYNSVLSNTAIGYNTLGGGYTWQTAANSRKQTVSTSGTFSSLAVELSAAPGNSGSYTITLLNITQGTSLAVTITDPATTNINTGTLSVAIGDVIQLKSTYASSPSATPIARWSAIFTGSNTSESLILSCGTSHKTIVMYYPIMHGNGDGLSSTEINTYQIIPTSGKVKNLYVVLNVDPGDPTPPADTYRFTLRLGNAANSYVVGSTALSCNITADSTTGYDTSDIITVAAGDIVDLMIEPLNTPATSVLAWMGMTFVADTDGESLLLGSNVDTPTIGTTEYNNIVSTGITLPAWTATEANVYQDGQSGVTLKKFYVMLSGAPGASKTYQLQIRATSKPGNTGITASISGASATTDNDTTHTYNIGDYDDLTIGCTTTASSAAKMVYWGLVCYIASTPAATVSPTDVAFGIVENNSSSATGLTALTVTNTGDVALDITISGTDLTGGGVTWTLSDNATVGQNICVLKAGTSGDYTINVKKTGPYETLKSNLGVSDNQTFGLKFYTPLTFTDPTDATEKLGTVTLIIVAH
jgi:hypothetical protein